MENWRLMGLIEAARNLATGLENMGKEQVEPSPSTEMPPLPDWWRRLNELEARLQALEDRLNLGPDTPPTTAEEPPGEMPSIIQEDGLVADFTPTLTVTISIHQETLPSQPPDPAPPGDAEPT